MIKQLPSMLLVMVWAAVAHPSNVRAVEPEAWKIVVMDPLAAPLSCACVSGMGQRRYDRLEEFLEMRLQRAIEVTYDESLELASQRLHAKFDWIIGKRSVVEFDANRLRLTLKPVAALTDRGGLQTLTGLVLVPQNATFDTLDKLRGRTIALGPKDNADVHQAAIDLFLRLAPLTEWNFKTYESIDSAVYAVTDGEADAGLVSDYLPRLLEGCGKIIPNSLKSIGKTAPTPFVTLFASSHVSEVDSGKMLEAIKELPKHPELLAAIESRNGFEDLSNVDQSAAWPDWRGPSRDGLSEHVPVSLPKDSVVWTAELTGPAMAGIAATDRWVVVADKSSDFSLDVFRCFEAGTGKRQWTLERPADREIEYTNAPRANPLIVNDLVYVLGAQGDLHCVQLESGAVRWSKNIVKEFGAQPLNWGHSSPPLYLDGKLIVNPGAKEASLVALNAIDGTTIWSSPGHAAAYGAFIVATIQDRKQIIGYDSVSLGGWDPADGKRLWTLIPPEASDFNVTTPVFWQGHLLLSTENNATRMYSFDRSGCINPEPVAFNSDLAPDTCTPIIVGGLVFAAGYGELFCLDGKDRLSKRWSIADDMFYDHTNLIGGNKHVLAWTTDCNLLLFRATGEKYDLVSHRRPFSEVDTESMSHPALVGDRLYLRNQGKLLCIKLTD
jgi:outer membrane protein assembly factor BamB/ABC-type phosphate/phosphonate transport system substrate-binding protein